MTMDGYEYERKVLWPMWNKERLHQDQGQGEHFDNSMMMTPIASKDASSSATTGHDPISELGRDIDTAIRHNLENACFCPTCIERREQEKRMQELRDAELARDRCTNLAENLSRKILNSRSNNFFPELSPDYELIKSGRKSKWG